MDILGSVWSLAGFEVLFVDEKRSFKEADKVDVDVDYEVEVKVEGVVERGGDDMIYMRWQCGVRNGHAWRQGQGKSGQLSK